MRLTRTASLVAAAAVTATLLFTDLGPGGDTPAEKDATAAPSAPAKPRPGARTEVLDERLDAAIERRKEAKDAYDLTGRDLNAAKSRAATAATARDAALARRTSAATIVTNTRAESTAAQTALAVVTDRVTAKQATRTAQMATLARQQGWRDDARAAGRKNQVARMQVKIAATKQAIAATDSALASLRADSDAARAVLTQKQSAAATALTAYNATVTTYNTANSALSAANTVVSAAAAARAAAEVTMQKTANRVAGLRNGVLPYPSAAIISEAPARFTIGTRNMWVGRAPAAPVADIIGFQEVIGGAARENVRSMPGYASYIPEGEAAMDSIAWRSDQFRLLAAGVTFTHGPVPQGTPSRWIVWTRLEHISTGQQLVFVNTHFIQNAYLNNSETGWRKPLWDKHRSLLDQVMARQVDTELPVFLTGDMNFVGNLGIEKMRRVESRPRIDQIYARALGRVETTELVELGKFGADHYSFRTTATINAK